MEVGSTWLATKLPAMLHMTEAWNKHRRKRQKHHPERTLASYVFQEAEGISREAIHSGNRVFLFTGQRAFNRRSAAAAAAAAAPHQHRGFAV